MNKEKKSVQWWFYIAIVFMVVLTYFPTFTGGFLLDDNPLIKNNKYIKNMHSVPSYLIQEDGITDKNESNAFHTGYYRPLINLTYCIDYQLWGMNASGFRATNLLLHLLSCLILLRLVMLLTNSRRVAFYVIIIFALHPVNTESVSWVSSRNNILVTLFATSSFYFYILFWRRKNYAAGFFSLILFLCALFSKEFGLMILPIFFLYHRLLSKETRNLVWEFSSYLPFIIVVALYFFLRRDVTGAILTPFDSEGLLQRIYFIPYLVFWNFKLVFAPFGLHNFNVSYPETIFYWPVLISICLFFILTIVLWKRRSNTLAVFSILSFMILIFPVLNVIPTASASVTLVSMRWLYMPMAFLCFGLVPIIKWCMDRSRMLTSSLMIISILYFGFYTYILNRDFWHDELVLFNQEVIRFDNDSFTGDLAEKLFQNGNLKDAEHYFRIALEKYPEHVENFINYSALLIETHRSQAAILYLNKAKTLEKTDHKQGEWLNNMGMALSRLGRMEKAIESFEKSVVFAPGEPAFWANLGSAYGIMGDYINALNAFQKGVDISPDSIQLWTNMAKTYMNMHEYKKAISTLEMIPEYIKEKNDNVSSLLKLAHKNLQSVKQ